MKNVAFAVGVSTLALMGCNAQQSQQLNTALASPAGQLFCAISTQSGPIVVGLIQAKAGASAAAPLAVIATGQTASYVNDLCKQAHGVPVSPPANPAAAPQVAVPVTA